MDPTTISLIAAIPQLASLTVNWIQERRYQTDSTDAQEASNMQSFIDYLREQQHQDLVVKLEEQTDTLERIEALIFTDLSAIKLALELLSHKTQKIALESSANRDSLERLEAICSSLSESVKATSLISGNDVMAVWKLISEEKSDEALERIDKLVEKLAPDKGLLAEFLVQKAMIIYSKGILEDSIKAFDEAHHAEPSNSKLWEGLACFHHQAGNTTQSLYFYTKCTDTDNLELKARSLHDLAVVYVCQEKFNDALQSYNESLQLSLKHNFIAHAAKCYLGLALLHNKLQERKEASDAVEESIKLSRTICPIEDETIVTALNLKAFWQLPQNPELAIKYAEEGWNLVKDIANKHARIRNTSTLTNCFIILGQACYIEKRHSDSILNYKAALAFSVKFKDLSKQLEIHKQLASLYAQIKHNENCLHHLTSARTIAEVSNNEQEFIATSESAARLAIINDLAPKAIELANSILEHPNLEEYPTQHSMAHKWLAEAHNKLGDQNRANFHLKEGLMLSLRYN